MLKITNPKLKETGKPLVFLVLLVIICLGSYFCWLESFELVTFDWRLKLRGQQLTSPEIAIIEISSDSLEQIGRWPFDRKYHAQLLRILSEYGIRQICFDIIFDQESSSDNKLIPATKRAGNVYYPFGRNVDLIDGLKLAARGYGHINITPDIDGKRRYIRPFIKIEEESIPQLSILMAADYLGRSPEDLLLPLDDRGRLIINYAGPWKGTFKHYSYADILVSFEQAKAGITPRLNLTELKDKVCFIGLTAVGTTDIAPTPLETVYPMLGVNANIFNSIITSNYLTRVNRGVNLLILILLLSSAIWLYRRSCLSFRWVFWLAILLTGFFFVSTVLFIWSGFWIDLAYPIVALLLIAFSLVFFSYIKERQKHLLLEHDLEIAAKLQQGFLSRTCLLEQAEIEVAAKLLPCRYIGGDFYDIIKLDNGLLAVFIGDVTGKGVPASLYMALSISIFRAYIKLYRQPAKILESVNRELEQRYPPGIFATAILLILDGQGKGCFANAGHIAMSLKNEDRIISLDAGGGMPLGITEDSEYNEMAINLALKDTLVLYTDGVLEAKKKGGEEFGEKRLGELIQKNDFLPAPVLAERILQGVSDFLQPAPSGDDLTVVVIKRNAVI
jgi:serine phosphatase RsbU (regulator of sigma subunit)/CHASE2 domain-containing sensor protein